MFSLRKKDPVSEKVNSVLTEKRNGKEGWKNRREDADTEGERNARQWIQRTVTKPIYGSRSGGRRRRSSSTEQKNTTPYDTQPRKGNDEFVNIGDNLPEGAPKSDCYRTNCWKAMFNILIIMVSVKKIPFQLI